MYFPKFEPKEKMLAVKQRSIRKAEEALGYTFPTQLKRFYQECNGGLLSSETNVFLITGSKLGPILVDGLYGVHESPIEESFDIVYENGLLYGSIPDDLLAIGCGPGGDELCIGFKGHRNGQIFFWLHEANDEESLIFVSNTLESFFRVLEPSEKYDNDEAFSPDAFEVVIFKLEICMTYPNRNERL
jgi:hypothetical protein